MRSHQKITGVDVFLCLKDSTEKEEMSFILKGQNYTTLYLGFKAI